MAPPYFKKTPWTPFIHEGCVYDLAHLEEYEFSVIDADATSRRIVVTFSDHCFTRKPLLQDDPKLIYPGASRNPGIFCFVRYEHTQRLPEYITRASNGKVWNVSEYQENFAVLPTIDHEGKRIFYAVIFSLERAGKDLPIDLHLRVRSAYPCDKKLPSTFGEIGFTKLVALTMRRKNVPRINDPHRKRPRLT